jgi:DNA-directed RNA polymerase subunit RPC12/RpoP
MSSQKRRKSDAVDDDTSPASGARASDELTDPATVEELIARKERDHGGGTNDDTTPDTRQYECLDCATTVDAFPITCPECGSTDFETGKPHEGKNTETPAEEIFAIYAELTAPYNPYVPR